MAVILQHSVFVHVPRTGGMWLRAALRNAGVPCLEFRGDDRHHMPHSELPACLRTLVPAFGFVRHPFTWVQSRWAHARQYHTPEEKRFVGVHRLFDECVRDTLADTIREILASQPGLVGRTFHTMLDGVGRVLRTEGLPENAVVLLAGLGEINRGQAEVIRETPPMNGVACGEVVPERLRREFVASEGVAVKIWEWAK